MKSRSSVIRSLAVAVTLLVVATGTWYLFAARHQQPGEGPGTPSHESQSRRPSAVSQSEEAEASLPTEEISFPESQWDAAQIKIVTVESGPLLDSIEVTGKIALNEDRISHIFPLVEGRVHEVGIGLGEHVKQGDELLVVQSKEVGQRMLQLFQDRLKLEAAEVIDEWTQQVGKNTHALIEQIRDGASIEQIEREFRNRPMGEYRQTLISAYIADRKAQAHLARLAPLSDSGAVPQRQILEAEAERDAANATLKSLLEQTNQDAQMAARQSSHHIKELKTSIAINETNLKILGFDDEDLADINPTTHGESLAHYPVVAPFDGTVISKDAVLLEHVSPDRQILTIADLSTVWVVADIYDTNLPLLSKLDDQLVTVHCDAWPEQEFTARVFYTGDVVQETTRTVALRAVAKNTQGVLKPGMFCTVELPALQTSKVLQVPVTALQTYGGVTFVFVQSADESFTPRAVTTGRKNHNAVAILSGLSAGDRVVSDGGFALKSQMLGDLLAE